MMALSGMSNDLFRFAVVGKALRLIKHHAFLFRRLLVLNMAKSYHMGIICYFSEREACQKHAEGALIALLSEFSSAIFVNNLELSSLSDDDDMFNKANQVLLDIVQQFLKYLGSNSTAEQIGGDGASSTVASATAEGEGKSNNRKISLGVKGITAVAPAIACLAQLQLQGVQEDSSIITSDGVSANQILVTLVRCCENLLLQMASRGHRGGDGEEERLSRRLVFRHDSDVILRKAQFVTAVATTMHSLLCAKAKRRQERGVGRAESEPGSWDREGDSLVDIASSSISSTLLSFLLSSGVDICVAYSRLWGISSPSTARCALCVLLRASAFSAPTEEGEESEDGRTNLSMLSCPSAAVSSVLEEVMTTLVPLLLLRAMSRAEDGELSELHSFGPTTGSTDQRLHVAYVPLWRELLCPRETETIRLLGIMAEGTLAASEEGGEPSNSYLQAVFPALINALFTEVYRVLQAFDLSYFLPSTVHAVEEEEEEGRYNAATSDDVLDDEACIAQMVLLPLPNNAADQELLLNLVTFLEAICPVLLHQFESLFVTAAVSPSSILNQQVCEWVFLLLGETVQLSSTWPMVSGLYRLCSVLCTMADSLQTTDRAGTCAKTGLGSAELSQRAGSGTMEKMVEEGKGKGSDSRDYEKILIPYFQETSRNILHTFQHPELVSAALAMIFSSPASLMTRPALTGSVYVPLLALALRSGVQMQAALKILFIYLDYDASNDYEESHPHSAVTFGVSETKENISQEKELKAEVLTDEALQILLPLLDRYLTEASASSAGIEGKHVSKSSKSKSRKKQSGGGGSSTPSYMVGGMEITENGAQSSQGDDALFLDESGKEVQVMVLRFLARLGGRNKFLLQSPSAAIASSLQWTSFRRLLTVDIPVSSNLLARGGSLSQSASQRSLSQQSGSVEVNVGAVVPRLVELCMGGGDTDTRPENRQLRLYAQECLHGIIHLMIGKVMQVTGADRSSGSEYCAMFAALFPTLITLSVSEDSLTKKLFDKLLFQIIHWLSTNSVSNSRLSDIYSSLMEHLMDGTAGDLTTSASSSTPSKSNSSNRNSNNNVIRDRCVSAVVECFRWACKHSQASRADSASDTSSSAASLTSVDGIIDRLLTLSTHPIERKRLGAVSVLNHLYVSFREDLFLVHKYALRVMFVVLNAVKQPGEGGGTSQATCALAVSHYMKIIVRVSEKDALDATRLRYVCVA